MSGTCTRAALGRTISVHVPMTLRKRGGRKLVVVPEGSCSATSPHRPHTALLRALARAHRWSRQLDLGEYASIAELAAAEKIDKSYVSKVLRLTLLAPELAEAIIWRAQSDGVRLEQLLEPFPNDWEAQKRNLIASEQPPRIKKQQVFRSQRGGKTEISLHFSRSRR